MERRTAAVAWMLSAGLLLMSQAARADGFVYRDRCPVPMNVVETEAYFCEATGSKDLGKRVEAAYTAWHGSLEPQLVGQCVTRLAELRIKELQGLAEGLGN